MAADTIFALSSGAGRAGVAVVRLSGSLASEAAVALGGPLPAARRASLRVLRDPSTGEAIDQALVLVFPAGASFTGEATVELHLHGGRAVVAAVLGALGRMPGLRLAAAGEFTRRAFENGRLDLAQVEALDDLIAADTAMQRRIALRGLNGRLGALVAGWRDQLLDMRALLAADIDFADEGDVGEEAAAGIDSHLLRLRGEMQAVLAARETGRIISDGYRVAIIGRPNSGKSSLLNVLSGSDAAIVTDIPGTTRDIIEVRLDWDGYEVVLVDTAGIRDTQDPVERIGVDRAQRAASDADLCLVLDENGDWSVTDEFGSLPDSIRIRTKNDLMGAVETEADHTIALSSVTGDGLVELRTAVLQRIRAAAPGENAVLVRQRQVDCLERALACVDRALACPAFESELRDHEVRSAELSLDLLVGRIGVEEVLGAVFSRFCIGK